MNRLTLWLSIAAVAAPLVAAPAAAQSRTTAQEIRDVWTTTKIEAEYFVDPVLKTQNIAISSDRGLVTLLGTVSDHRTRDHAVLVARSTSGVKDVVDLLVVGTAPTTATTGTETQDARLLDSDPAIASQVRMLLAIDPDVEPPRVGVSVDHGIVDLTGTVDPIAHDRALEIARSVQGVRRIDDHLTLH